MALNFLKVPRWGQDQQANSESDFIDLSDFINTSALTPGVVGVDYETNGKDIRDGRGYTQGVGIAYRAIDGRVLSHYLPFRHKYGYNLDFSYRDQLDAALRFREEAGLPISYHNSKGDLEFGNNLGIKLTGETSWCTMLMAHIVNEMLPYAKDLDSVSKHYLKKPGKKETPEFQLWIDKVGWENVPSEEMYGYTCQDAETPVELYDVLRKKLKQEGTEHIWTDVKRYIVNVFRDMERRGVLIDQELCNRQAAIGRYEMEDVTEYLGMNPGSRNDLQKLLIDQLGLPVLKRSKKTNNPSFDKEVMKEYDEILENMDDERAKLILQYRGWQKATTSNYEPYVNLLSPDGRLRCNYKLHGTKTFRCSCEKPNLQQIPRVSEYPWNGKMKQAFVPMEGYVLLECDYSQLEFRLAAAYAEEKELIEIFNDDTRDVFTEMAEKLKMNRMRTKTLNYTIQYGGGIRRLSNVFGVSPDRASAIRNDYFDAYPGIRRITNYAAMRVKTTGRVKIWSGRYRHFLYPKEEAHKGFNAVCQGGAADILERSQLRIAREIPDLRMLLQVHDSLVFEVRKEDYEDAAVAVKEIMEDVPFDFGVKFKVDTHMWGE